MKDCFKWLFAAACASFSWGCIGSGHGGELPAAPTASGTIEGCLQEIAILCPEGQEDSCIRFPYSHPRRCVARSWDGSVSASCAQEFSPLCEADLIDPCLIDRSVPNRSCVKVEWTSENTQAGSEGSRCPLGERLQCPMGQEDSCISHPSLAPRRCVAENWDGKVSEACAGGEPAPCEGRTLDTCMIHPATNIRECVDPEWTP